jgi:polyprenyl-phospho-N-acetylgalactosaminyl synthase
MTVTAVLDRPATRRLLDPEVAARTFVVIPAFNEERVVRETVLRVLDTGAHVVVVDDCSTDRTVDRVVDLPIFLLGHVVNLGQGAALQTGIDFALAQGARFIVMFDADGQHDERDIPSLVIPLTGDCCDIVLGSRFLGRALDMSPARRLLLKGAILFTRLTMGMRLTDVHNGLRAFRAEAAGSIRLTQNRMAHASEILHKIHASGLRFKEVPATVRYTPYSRAKGQTGLGLVDILYDLVLWRILR